MNRSGVQIPRTLLKPAQAHGLPLEYRQQLAGILGLLWRHYVLGEKVAALADYLHQALRPEDVGQHPYLVAGQRLHLAVCLHKSPRAPVVQPDASLGAVLFVHAAEGLDAVGQVHAPGIQGSAVVVDYTDQFVSLIDKGRAA